MSEKVSIFPRSVEFSQPAGTGRRIVRVSFDYGEPAISAYCEKVIGGGELLQEPLPLSLSELLHYINQAIMKVRPKGFSTPIQFTNEEGVSK